MPPDFYIVYGRTRLGDEAMLYITTSQKEAYERKEEYLKQWTTSGYFSKFMVRPFDNKIYL